MTQNAPSELAFFDRLRSNPRPVVVDVWAAWCVPCRAIKPAIERLTQAYAGQVDVWEIDADTQPKLVRALGVRGIPTLVVFRGDREITRRTGIQSQKALASLFESALAGKAPPRSGPSRVDRLLRISASGILLLTGLSTGPSLFLIGLGGVILLSAVYDRCPLWRMIAPRLMANERRCRLQAAGTGARRQ